MERRTEFIICRLCLNESECLIDIFEDKEGRGNAPAEIITDLLQFDVSKADGYPPAICAKCFDKLTEFRCFKEQCLLSKLTYDSLYTNEKHLEDDLQPTRMMTFESIKTEPVDVVEDEYEDTFEDAVDDEEELQRSLPEVKMEALDGADNIDQTNYQPEILKQEELIIQDDPAWGDLEPVPLKLVKTLPSTEVSPSIPCITVNHQQEDLNSEDDPHDETCSPMDMVQATLDVDSQCNKKLGEATYLETTKSSHGGLKVSHKGFIYHKDRTGPGNKVYWACEWKLRQCKGRITTIHVGGEKHKLLLESKNKHNHDPDIRRFRLSHALAIIRHEAQRSKKGMPAFIREVKKWLSKEVIEIFPTDESLEGMVKRIQKKKLRCTRPKR